MRIRQIKPEFWKHVGLADLSRDIRLLFLGLIQMADCEGRLDFDPRLIKSEVFPMDEDVNSQKINEWILELSAHKENFITVYEVGSYKYLQVNGFRKHQHLMGNERTATSKRPPPKVRTRSVLSQKNSRASTADIRSNGYTDKRKDGSSCRSNSRCTDEEKSVAVFIFEKIKSTNPGHKEPNLDAWGNDVRLMVERDGRSLEAIRELFTWANQDSFWCGNILSPAKLREKWDQLQIKKHKGALTVQPIHPYDRPEFQRQETYSEKIARIKAEDEAWLALREAGAQ